MRIRTTRDRWRSGWRWILLLPVALLVPLVGACLPVGLGDPEASTVDPALTGVWEALDETGAPTGELNVVIPFDAHTYLMRVVNVQRTADGIVRKPGEECYKTWLTPIGGRTFLTAQPLYLKETLVNADVPGFVVARIDLAEDGQRLRAYGVDPDFPALGPLRRLPGHANYKPAAGGEKALTEGEARALLRKVIAENAGQAELFDLANYIRVTDQKILRLMRP